MIKKAINNYIKKYFYKTRNININLDKYIIYHYYKPVNKNKNWVIALIFLINWNWQKYYKIY